MTPREYLQIHFTEFAAAALLLSVGLTWLCNELIEHRRVRRTQAIGIVIYFAFALWIIASILAGRFMPTPG